jgi:hypothetical protein
VTAQGITGPPIPVTDVTGLQAVLDDLQDQIDAIDGGGGGGGTPVAVVSGYVTTGNVSTVNTSGSVVVLPGGPTFSIAAAAGDRIRFDWTGLTQKVSATFWDVAVLVGGSAVRYAATGTGTPGVEGDPGYYPDSASFPGHPGPFAFTVEAGDISGGNVTIGFVLKSDNTAGLLFASTSFPLRYTITNYGPAS